RRRRVAATPGRPATGRGARACIATCGWAAAGCACIRATTTCQRAGNRGRAATGISAPATGPAEHATTCGASGDATPVSPQFSPPGLTVAFHGAATPSTLHHTQRGEPMSSRLAGLLIVSAAAAVAAGCVEERPGYVWVHAYWRWEGGRYVATAGHWREARPGYHYVHPHWEQRNDGWHFHVGVWVSG